MTKTALKISVCAIFAYAGTALGAPTAQQQCDYGRITAGNVYTSCINTVVAKDAKVAFTFNEYAAYAKCRHAYFKKWTAFQSKAGLATSTCIGTRFMTTDSGATVTDGLTGLVWEKKTNLDAAPNLADPHDADNGYTWSTGAPWREDGTAFTGFLSTLNGGSGFAGANGWRLPTFVELQTIVLDFTCPGGFLSPTCSCESPPCIDGSFGPTQPDLYLSATTHVPVLKDTLNVGFGSMIVDNYDKAGSDYVRAVRGGF